MRDFRQEFHSFRGRLLVGSAVAVLTWFVSFPRLLHRCLLGLKWFEHYGPFVLAGVVLLLVLSIRRYRWSLPSWFLAVFAFNAVIVPRYLAWVHDPQSRYFAPQRAEMQRRDEAVLTSFASAPSVPADAAGRQTPPESGAGSTNDAHTAR